MRRNAPTLLVAVSLGMLVVAPPSSATTFNPPSVVASEDVRDPDVEIGLDGRIYVGAAGGLPTASRFYRSADGGATWVTAPLLYRSPVPGGLAYDLTVARDSGALAFTDLWGGSSTVGRSTDGGATWMTQPFQGEVAQERPWVAAAGGNVVYHATHSRGVGIVVAKSIDGGFTYGTRMVVAPDATRGCICPSGNIVASGDRFAVGYSTSTGVTVARSASGGLTVTTTVVDPTGGLSTLESYPVLAHGGGSSLALAWLEAGTTSSRVRLSVSNDWGATWSPPMSVVTAGASVHPWVAMSGSLVGISLYHTTATGAPDTVPSSAVWYESYVESTNAGSTWSGVQRVDASPVKTGPICTDGMSCSGDAELGNRQAMAFDADGRPNIVYLRSVNGVADTELRYVRGS